MVKISVLTTVPMLVISITTGGGMEVKRNEEGRMVQQMKVEAPILSEEDQWGQVMPDIYRCDSCKAVVFHLNQALKKRQIKSRRMHEWEYNELFEETCNGAFEGYGIKLIDGKNTLSGPGLKQPDKSMPAGAAFIQMGGKGWSNRLSDICRSIVYDKIGEDELYEKYYTNRKLPDSMCYEEMAQCGGSSKVKTSKVAGKKIKSKTASAAVPAKSKDLPKVEVKADGSSTRTNKTGPGGVDAIDADSFLRSLALEDGLDFDAYSTKRSRQEWEQLVVSMAGKIYSRQV
eukprot:gnl/MRDRNA2_/MRDRNA2_88254_c0_seq1.p1 gnl/MRDRNA2_/MRDRNA2_88254_c0~~gnl/MRDRNA2_/MRDRNA2_88254_c0_seq1.p1  ORF type:complete len:287 (+),score=56.79 gnl/MRDRNA2_/MRDRNA2_88254_c0_seq1:74-934(+)